MTLHMVDADDYDVEAPQPVDADSIARGSFEQLTEGQGAKAAQRGSVAHGNHAWHDERDAAPLLSKRVLVVLVTIAAAVICVSVALFLRMFNSSATEANGAAVEQAEAAADGTIAYRESSYALVESVNGYELAELKGDGSPYMSLGEVPGSPAGLILFDGTLVIPENLPDGTWDVLAYTIGSGWSKIMSDQKTAQTGTGTISEAHLDGSALRLVVDGSEVLVPLVW
jgi:hypothetical protein